MEGLNKSGCFLLGSTLLTVGEYERRLGAAEREFLQTSAISYLTPLRNFLEGDWRTISVSLEHYIHSAIISMSLTLMSIKIANRIDCSMILMQLHEPNHQRSAWPFHYSCILILTCQHMMQSIPALSGADALNFSPTVLTDHVIA